MSSKSPRQFIRRVQRIIDRQEVKTLPVIDSQDVADRTVEHQYVWDGGDITKVPITFIEHNGKIKVMTFKKQDAQLRRILAGMNIQAPEERDVSTM